VPPAPHRRPAIDWLTRRIRAPRAEPPQSDLINKLHFLLAGDQALSEVWFAQLFVMRPESNYFNRLDVFQNLIHQSMLYVDATGTCTSQIADQFLERRWILIRIQFQDLKQSLGFWLQSRRLEFFSVLLSLFGEDKRPAHHLSSLLHFPTGVLMPSRMDSRIPGMAVKKSVS
jgi:hypothetical protein